MMKLTSACHQSGYSSSRELPQARRRRTGKEPARVAVDLVSKGNEPVGGRQGKEARPWEGRGISISAWQYGSFRVSRVSTKRSISEREAEGGLTVVKTARPSANARLYTGSSTSSEMR
jgi:hypothetical protein